MIDYSLLLQRLAQGPLKRLADDLPQKIAAGLCTQRHGDLPLWYAALNSLPTATPSRTCLQEGVSIGCPEDLTEAQHQHLHSALQQLIPWRKGPLTLFGHTIDTEWRSDWKWQRLAPHISPLRNRRVLDVGCGNGYYAWRMLGAGAQEVIGIDPSPRFVVQFALFKHYFPQAAVDVLPLTLEALPPKLACFDTCFSMGVLYHRRSPMDHLRELKDTLRPGGELVLETLVIEGDEGRVLVPPGRYASMSNVWFIPSVPTLMGWLRKCGFEAVRCVDVNQTQLDEQRSTDWMRFLSLKDFLDPNNSQKTQEGHPAPLRALLIAQKPLNSQ